MANNPETPRPVLLLTRPQAASEAQIARLPADLRDRLRIVISPIMEIVGRPLQHPVDGAGVIFSSANAVTHAAEQDVSRTIPAYVVGETTARAARAAGWDVQCVAETADDLVNMLGRWRPKGPIIHLHGTHTRGNIAARLTERGLPTRGRVIYDQVPVPLRPDALGALTGPDPVVLPVFSPRSARMVSDTLTIDAPTHAIALSPAVAEALHLPDIHALHVCATPTREAMDAALREVVGHLCRVEGAQGGH